jgi:glutathione reductase (NADPH)
MPRCAARPRTLWVSEEIPRARVLDPFPSMAGHDYDLFTIGAGSGGVAASRRAGSHGAKVALCEASRVGGTCVMRGCVPKKILVYASHLRDTLEDAGSYGWSLADTTLDWSALIDAKNRELDYLEGVYRRLLDRANVAMIEGRGKILDPHTVEVDGRRITAGRILVATGGRPWIPGDIPGAELGITSDEALELREIPRRLVIVGGGYVAVELAGVFAGAGAKVTILLRSYEVLGGFDPDVRSALGEAMRKKGITIEPHVVIEAVERRGEDVVVCCRSGDEHPADTLLWATGRRPNTAGLGLEDVGVALDDGGAITVDEWSHTSVHGIFAIGDCTNRIALTPVAIADGRALAETLFNDNPTKVDHDHVPTAVFSQPPVATVGLTEPEARAARPGPIDVYRTTFRPLQYALPGRQERTMMKLVVDRSSDDVLGVHIVGPDAPEILQGFAVALKAGAKKAQFDATIGIHPTSAEELVTLYTREP